jgi:hypothetical protein
LPGLLFCISLLAEPLQGSSAVFLSLSLSPPHPLPLPPPPLCLPSPDSSAFPFPHFSAATTRALILCVDVVTGELGRGKAADAAPLGRAIVTEELGRGRAAGAAPLGRAIVDATFNPDWWTRLPAVRKELEQQVNNAAAQGAFIYSSTFCEEQHPLYIRPTGLFEDVKEKLRQGEHAKVGQGEAAEVASGTRGVLIYGSKGMGKTSLAKDVAFEFAFDSGVAASFVITSGNLATGI